MNDTKLTDFTEEQLQDLLAEVLFGLTVHEFGTNKYENLRLWHTQILNAISTVKMRETTQAN